ncbi:MAG: flagellar export chaperone FliS [Gammaproteobacteria bacterium]|jgi:flagellar protein FliS|nr:flagellar export chaperone FliS [Gammaproteobacteria bacterium]MDG1232571.1 flagellar export chaperone FliS [Pseudomonadales bacterium]MBT5152912.1 flagellar export chaperone FliS [Gammaproteobacteria bacterium]MBT5685194.1 flagellar export chaperone FliS [Gammaproteobacteria bacterium]MBT5723507.1 flagellar export chaperone FliS [Gammaproteobacteria bacterium]
MNAVTAVKAYSFIDNVALVEQATPHQLVTLLMRSANQRLAQALKSVEQNDISAKSEHLSKALDIFNYLSVCVEPQQGGEDLSENLLNLYAYMKNRILHANLHHDAAPLIEIKSLLMELETGWQAISGSDQNV